MSANAFAQATAKNKQPKKEPDSEAPPKKRPRLSNDARAQLETRTASEDTALEVDHMILDYLAYQSILACLASRDTTSNTQETAHVSLPDNLAMTDSFMAIFQTRHPTYELDEELRFRLRLLQFTTLFTQRLTRNPSTPTRNTLKDLREANRKRSMTWIGSKDRMPSHIHDLSALDSHFPLSRKDLSRNRVSSLTSLQVPAEDEEAAFYGTPQSLSLSDLLPLFMRLSADLHSLLEREPAATWMDLAAEMMLQASLEQYLVRGASGTDAVDEAFAWGPLGIGEPPSGQKPPGGSAEKENEEEPVAKLFTPHTKPPPSSDDEDDSDDPQNAATQWPLTKQIHITRLIPPTSQLSIPLSSSTPTTKNSSSSLANSNSNTRFNNKDRTRTIAHLQETARTHPLPAFDAKVRSLLRDVARIIPPPILAQREEHLRSGGKKGVLDGMSLAETRELWKNYGRKEASIESEEEDEEMS